MECGWHVTGAVWVALTLSVNNLLISSCLLGSSSFSHCLTLARLDLVGVTSVVS